MPPATEDVITMLKQAIDEKRYGRVLSATFRRHPAKPCHEAGDLRLVVAQMHTLAGGRLMRAAHARTPKRLPDS